MRGKRRSPKKKTVTVRGVEYWRAASEFKIEPDWTWDAQGRSNSSPEFLALCAEVERLIRNDAFSLISGNAGSTARLIMAQLAHVHGLSPSPSRGQA